MSSVQFYKRRKPRQIEQTLQEQFVVWLDSLLTLDGDKILFCASAGGMRAPRRAAIRMKRAGYKKGSPDVTIYEARGGWHGMTVEAKVGTYPDQDQKKWRDRLLRRGYYAVIVPGSFDFWEARQWLEKETIQYLEGKIQRLKKGGE